jgi:hypothetical protein
MNLTTENIGETNVQDIAALFLEGAWGFCLGSNQFLRTPSGLVCLSFSKFQDPIL